MSRPIKAFVDTKALKANLSCVRQKSAQSQILSVVKANAYGHGIERVFEGLKGSDGFGVLQVGEAEVLLFWFLKLKVFCFMPTFWLQNWNGEFRIPSHLNE